MPKFAIYSRKSKFTGKGDSVENQVEMCTNYIKTHFQEQDIEISVYEDEGFSGKSLNRPHFIAMMNQERSEPFDYIVVYRLDRISRNVGDFASLIEKLNKYETSFICIKEQFDTSTPMGRAMMNIAAVFAQLERETIAERIKDNMYLQAKSGKWTGGTTPYGYKSVECVSHDKDGKSRSYYTLTFDEEQIKYAKLCFSKFVELQSINAVTKFFNEHGYYTQKGNKWAKTNMKRILTNPVYCIADKDSLNYFKNLGCVVCFDESDCDGISGILPYNRFIGQRRNESSPDKWLITISNHQGILSGYEFARVQALLKQASKNSFTGQTNTRRATNPNSILSGVLRCKCGAYMRPKKYKSGKLVYICENKLDNGVKSCTNSNVDLIQIDNLVKELLFDFEADDNYINKKIKGIKDKISNLNNEVAEQIKSLQKRKDENNENINKLLEVFSKDVSITLIDLIDKKVNKLKEENDLISQQIIELSNKESVRAKLQESYESKIDALKYLKENFDKLSIASKREFMKKIIDKVVWDGETANIFINGE